MPVNPMAMPCSLAASMTSLSRIEPPGWMTAVTPTSAAWSRPSRNGKNASEAMTLPCTSSPASGPLIQAGRPLDTAPTLPASAPPASAGEHAYIRLAGKDRLGILVHFRGNDYLDELPLQNVLGGGGVE